MSLWTHTVALFVQRRISNQPCSPPPSIHPASCFKLTLTTEGTQLVFIWNVFFTTDTQGLIFTKHTDLFVLSKRIDQLILHRLGILVNMWHYWSLKGDTGICQRETEVSLQHCSSPAAPTVPCGWFNAAISYILTLLICTPPKKMVKAHVRNVFRQYRYVVWQNFLITRLIVLFNNFTAKLTFNSAQ